MSKQSQLPVTGSTICLILGTLFLVGGWSVVTLWGKPTLQNAKESVEWPTVKGVVTESKVSSHSGDGSTTYSANIIYRYSVNNTLIHSERVWFGDNYSTSNRSMFTKIVQKYPVGKEVTVYYKPDDEFISVLEPGPVTSSYIGNFVGWVLLAIGGGLLLIPMVNLFKTSQGDTTNV